MSGSEGLILRFTVVRHEFLNEAKALLAVVVVEIVTDFFLAGVGAGD